MRQILDAFDDLHRCTGKPKLIIAETVKGKGVSFMENNKKWHHGHLSDAEFAEATADLDRELEELQ